MKKIIFSAICINLVLLMSCTPPVYTGILSSSACLSAGNFSYIRQNIKGESYVKIIPKNIIFHEKFPLVPLVNEAKQQMLLTHPLQNNQALANVTVEFTSFSGKKVTFVKCIVTADVVEFNGK